MIKVGRTQDKTERHRDELDVDPEQLKVGAP